MTAPDPQDESPNARGIRFAQAGQWSDAIAAFEQAIAVNPSNPWAYFNMGSALQSAGRLQESVEAYRRSLAIGPDNAGTHCYLAEVLAEQGNFDQAFVSFRKALELKPDFPQATDSFGKYLRSVGKWEEAIAVYRHAIAIRPDFAIAHVNLAKLLLLRGELSQGWKELLWWWILPQFPKPKWNGEDLAGRRLLLYCVGGFGDTIQFIRYLPWIVSHQGGQIVLCCFPQLKRLFQQLPGVDLLVTNDQNLPEFDLHCHFPGLSVSLAPSLEEIPAPIPYLHADPALVARWSEKLRGESARLKVGIVWGGSRNNEIDSHRSIPLSSLKPLADVAGVKLFSLQKGPYAEELKQSPFPIVDWTAELTDFADTAALIANLDLVITIETAVAHLAGAMGKRVWVLLADPPDWRWMLDRADSPWYPTMRLFRQKRTGNWDDPVREIVAALSDSF